MSIPEATLENDFPSGMESIGTMAANSWVFPPRRMRMVPQRSCRFDNKFRKGTVRSELFYKNSDMSSF